MKEMAETASSPTLIQQLNQKLALSGSSSKLRFPKFRGSPLRSVQLGDVTEESRARNGGRHSVASVMGVSNADGIVPMEARLIAADIERYKIVEHDWFAYNPMRLNIGSIARWKGEGEILVSPDYVVFKCIGDDVSGMLPGYFEQFRQSKAWEDFVTEGGDGGVRVRIYYKDIARLQLELPSISEQKRIAECLSTLDELVGAETQKLDALQTRKQGLMQQLFPRQWESAPHLRFPEFRSGPEWMIKLGGELFSSRKEAGEAGLPLYSVTTHEGMVPRASFDRDFYDIEDPAGNRKVCKGDIAYNMMRMWQGAQGVAPEDCLVSPAYVVLAPQEAVCAEFFAYYFKLPQMLELLTATSRGLTKDRLRLYFDDFARMRMCVPAFAEQQRIASCLASLDELIAAHGKKREALESFKRYLMQQLFPATDQV